MIYLYSLGTNKYICHDTSLSETAVDPIYFSLTGNSDYPLGLSFTRDRSNYNVQLGGSRQTCFDNNNHWDDGNQFAIVAMDTTAITLADTTAIQSVSIGKGDVQTENSPICNWWMDTYQGSEMLYTSEELGLKKGARLSAIKFHCNTNSGAGGSFDLRMKEFNDLKAFDTTEVKPNITAADSIYQSYELESYSGGSDVVFNFEKPYVYQGGDLVIDIRNSKPGSSSGWCYFKATKTDGIPKCMIWWQGVYDQNEAWIDCGHINTQVRPDIDIDYTYSADSIMQDVAYVDINVVDPAGKQLATVSKVAYKVGSVFALPESLQKPFTTYSYGNGAAPAITADTKTITVTATTTLPYATDTWLTLRVKDPNADRLNYLQYDSESNTIIVADSAAVSAMVGHSVAAALNWKLVGDVFNGFKVTCQANGQYVWQGETQGIGDNPSLSSDEANATAWLLTAGNSAYDGSFSLRAPDASRWWNNWSSWGTVGYHDQGADEDINSMLLATEPIATTGAKTDDEVTLPTNTTLVKGLHSPGELDYAIYSNEQRLSTERTLTLPINMKNKSAISLWQADVKLPRGFSLAKEDNGEEKIALSDARTSVKRHGLAWNKLANGSYRLICTSPTNAEFTGTDGEVATITLNVDTNLVNGDYRVLFTNVLMVQADDQGFAVDSVKSNIHIFAKTDVQNLDYAIYAYDIKENKTSTLTLRLRMKNKTAITLWQADLTLPEGFSIAKDFLGDEDINLSTSRTSLRNHVLSWNWLKNGKLRLLCSSMRNAEFSDNDGEVATITLSIADSVKNGSYPITLTNVLLVQKDGTGYPVSQVTSEVIFTDDLLGDVNEDGRVDGRDVVSVANLILTDTYDAKGDVNLDNTVDGKDYVDVVNYVLNSYFSAKSMFAPRRVSGVEGQNYTLYGEDVTIEAGKQVQMPLYMTNKTPVTLFQADMILPGGIIVPKTDEGYLIELTGDRVSYKTHNFAMNEPRTGDFKMLCSSMQNTRIKGTEGQVGIITLQASADLAPGVYEGRLSGILLVDSTSNGYSPTQDCTFRITVTSPFDGVVLDENYTTAPNASDGATNVKVKRTLKANEWSTLCLPFAMTGDQVTSAFGSDVKIGDFSNWTEEYASDDDEYPSTINVEFTSVAATAGLEANHPYIIKTSSDITEITADGVTIAPEDEPAVSVGSKRKGTLGTFSGNYVAGTVVPEANLFLSDNQFWYSVGKTKIKAFRGYFELYDVTKYYQENSGTTGAKVNIVFDDNTTNISRMENDSQQDGRVYSISGTVVGKDVNALPHGVYIVNGKKIVK